MNAEQKQIVNQLRARIQECFDLIDAQLLQSQRNYAKMHLLLDDVDLTGKSEEKEVPKETEKLVKSELPIKIENTKQRITRSSKSSSTTQPPPRMTRSQQRKLEHDSNLQQLSGKDRPRRTRNRSDPYVTFREIRFICDLRPTREQRYLITGMQFPPSQPTSSPSFTTATEPPSTRTTTMPLTPFFGYGTLPNVVVQI